MYSWEEHLSAAPLDCKHIQESFEARRRIMPASAIAFARSEFVFAGHTAPFSNRAWGDYCPRAAAFRGDGKG
jgi:hypothetical protein